ncbi:aspartyl/asparaginyl beta-hydroxylase domain-containing protein [Sphingosinicella ginsenosidimutans]|uniref:Aspartyl/asparaginyl beta-hydroxylase domain-containing protein n=2 Tax=Allosphingosinicella ginsenosidimutans TaxID=1176539 RepID=A0A5C6TZ47_9SPHN|nr:aspartyl/asparaginyl beta-hydroxylase domain-containing protein [Sphingosinicella ginsenosidimutans]
MDSQDPAALEAEADRAAARGDLAAARALLERTVALDRSRADSWLKLSAICRGLGDLQAALVGVSGALAVEPLGFVPLLLKANILEKLGREAEAGEAYGHALAQQPQSVASHLRQMTEHAKRMHAAHVERMAARLDGALDAAAAKLDGCERRRAERFRDNIVRRTRPFHSEPTHFHYPGLREREFHDREDFPWLAELEAATDPILADFNRVLTAERAELEPYIQYPESAPLRQWAALNRNRDWTAIHLVRGGVPVEANARHCPTTIALLEHLEQPVIPGRGPNAMFSLLAPGAHIPPHNGVSNARLVCHLPLIVPPRCWFRVGAETREWKVGAAWVFDDTIEHEAMNGSDALRVLLIVDTWHPDLSPGERGAVSAMIAASGFDDGPEAL